MSEPSDDAFGGWGAAALRGLGRLFRIAAVVFLAWPKLQITVIIMFELGC